ncbi:PEP/pyruvate-binding domain-containing protein [Leifsonia sp. C5G2]|uniref:PEP/pyruvate-binding domain-containing protein n=1 Tax=Leifsonia sp. C5G2 TaxID=2735269 RepID=UPI00201BB149|nr:PEP/pyruvate-binding domain-containing protein [Leifsonia sp. C5G2]
MLVGGFAVPHAIAIDPEEDLHGLPFDEQTVLAVRSSGFGEDDTSESHAGRFTTVLNVDGEDAVRIAVHSVRASGDNEMPMGVVIQEMVEAPILSGVAFSCHPITLDPELITISWVAGLGVGLVDGTAKACELEVRRIDGAIASGDWPLSAELLTELVHAVIALDGILDSPVDVEWTIDSDGALLLLQVRPVVIGPALCVDLDRAQAFDSLPGPVKSHNKISLRRDAVRLHIPMSRARAVVATRGDSRPSIPEMVPSEESSGRSVVLLHPRRVNGRIVRKFSMDRPMDVELALRGCERYAIRQYPDPNFAVGAVERVLATGLEASPLSCVIEQELLYAYATGILRRTREGYLIELAVGHFVPKGYVETCTFVLNEQGEVLLRSRPLQSKAYQFVNGHVVVESPPFEQLDVSDIDLERTVSTLVPLINERPSAAIEFGLLGVPGRLAPYMIDIAESDDKGGRMSSVEIERGIVSSGSAVGTVVDLRVAPSLIDLDSHLHDGVSPSRKVSTESSIYVARRASVELLTLVRTCHPSSGFVFEQASLLSHLAVVMRERGIAGLIASPEVLDRLTSSGGRWRLDTSKKDPVTPAEVSAN